MINNSQELNIDEIVGSILESVPQAGTAKVKLPSLGKIYGLESEYITIRAMSFQDEKALLTLKDRTQAVNTLIKRCVEEDLDPTKLISQDKIFIIVNIRALSIGESYDINVTCGACQHKSSLSIDVLDVFSCDYPEQPLERFVEIDLPVIKKKAIVRRANSEELEGGLDKVYSNLWTFIKSIDGREETAVKLAVVDKLPLADIHHIVRSISSESVGLNTQFIFECVQCGHEEVTDLSLNQDFFMMR